MYSLVLGEEVSLLAKLSKKAGSQLRGWMEENFQKAMNLYPPYVGAGVSVDHISEDHRRVDVSMKLTPFNRNYVGTHFGGSLYAMCDPFYMLMLMKNLGSDYIVWDKAASIDFRRPGRGCVRARFELSQERIDEIREAADTSPKVEPRFVVDVVDEHGEVVAHVEKLLYVRRKDRSK
jgi:acyl-coenzyme A thioesterase PaaI-like protein